MVVVLHTACKLISELSDLVLDLLPVFLCFFLRQLFQLTWFLRHCENQLSALEHLLDVLGEPFPQVVVLILILRSYLVASHILVSAQAAYVFQLRGYL